MNSTRYASVLGLGFGDCGKGHFVDALTRRWHAHTVVRFNGGAQAGHNVLTRDSAGSPALHHTFSQLGAGTFVPGTQTLLADPMVVHPTALLVEADVLSRKGIDDALSRLTVDAHCRITTPYHQAAGQLRERLRGAAAHGTCGVGVGETVRHSLEHPGQVIRYADLLQSSQAHTRALMEKLQAIRGTLLAELLPLCPTTTNPDAFADLRPLKDEALATTWLNHTRALARHCPPASHEIISAQLQQPGCVLFEGAQGVLLDEWRGFHPHTTWSTIHTSAVDDMITRFGIQAPIEHYGVLRSYLTRHGAGPLPTHDASLDDLLPEPHNHSAGWQGPFRRGHPDAVLLRYALGAIGNLSGLLVSHLDVFQRGITLKWCEKYFTSSSLDVAHLPLSENKDLEHQERLTDFLFDAQPSYAAEPIHSAAAFLDCLAKVTALPVIIGSYGPVACDVR